MPDDKKKDTKKEAEDYAKTLISASNEATYAGNQALANELLKRANEELDKEEEERLKKSS